MRNAAEGAGPGMRTFSGLTVSPGFGEGVAFVYLRRGWLSRVASNLPAGGGADVELARLESARAAASAELESLAHNLQEKYDLDEANIFRAHFLILEDDLLAGLMRERVDKGGSAEAAVVEAVASVEEMFRKQVDPYVRERWVDVRDVGSRILKHLIDREHHPFGNLPDGAVIVADELFPSDTAFLDRAKVRAVVTVHGSENSHAAILSRALGIPAVTGVAGILEAVSDGDSVAVDGESGRVFVRLSDRERVEYGRRARAYQVAHDELDRSGVRAVTEDGLEIALLANVDREDELAAAVDRHADGIGLLRTEILHLRGGGPLSEDRQEEVYRYAAQCMGGRPVHVRIFDMAPDKASVLTTDGVAVGAATPECGIHFALAHPEILQPQLRAVVRAADAGNIGILLPGVTGVEEIAAFRRLLAEVEREHGARSRSPIPVGAMIETPSALVMLDDIAEAADFLSLGTNDLLRHLFGRSRARVEETACEPSLLRSIAHAVRIATRRQREITVCGEVGGDPAFTALLIGMGLRHLSMSPQRIPEVRYNIAHLRAEESGALAQRALSSKSVGEIEALLRENVDPWHRLVRSREAEARSRATSETVGPTRARPK